MVTFTTLNRIALLHCIDVTYANDDYYYEGDGNRVPYALESKHIHIDNCETYACGDDSITTIIHVISRLLIVMLIIQQLLVGITTVLKLMTVHNLCSYQIIEQKVTSVVLKSKPMHRKCIKMRVCK